MSNRLVRSVSLTLAVCLLAGCNLFSNKAPSVSAEKDDSPKETASETTEAKKETVATSSTTATTTTEATTVLEEKLFQLEDSMLNPILSDTISFMFKPDELYMCDVNGDGTDDCIWIKDYCSMLLCYMSGDNLYVNLPNPGGNLRLELYYSPSLEKFMIRRVKGVASYGFDEYLYYNNGVFEQDASYSFELENGNITEEYTVRGDIVSEEEYNDRVYFYDLLSLAPVDYVPVRKTDIPSEQIPALKDKLLAWTDDANKQPVMTDLNKDGIQDLVISFDPQDDIWENAVFATESLKPEANFSECTLIILSSKDGVEVRCYDTDEAAQVVTEMLNE